MAIVFLTNGFTFEHITTASYFSVINSSVVWVFGCFQKCYSVVVYLRVVNSNTGISVNFITVKCKVVPLKSNKLDKCISIPRFELCGALLLAQTFNCINKILEELVINIKIHVRTFLLSNCKFKIKFKFKSSKFLTVLMHFIL